MGLLSQGPYKPAEVYAQTNGSYEGPDATQQRAYFPEMGIPSQLPYRVAEEEQHGCGNKDFMGSLDGHIAPHSASSR